MNIVCIGGGHGLSQVLSALKTMPCSLTAIVTTTDNGGSTGRLRQDQSQIALGDIRRYVSALANQDNVLSVLSAGCVKTVLLFSVVRNLRRRFRSRYFFLGALFSVRERSY